MPSDNALRPAMPQAQKTKSPLDRLFRVGFLFSPDSSASFSRREQGLSYNPEVYFQFIATRTVSGPSLVSFAARFSSFSRFDSGSSMPALLRPSQIWLRKYWLP